MYGYVRPNKDQLRMWEYRQYRAAYCGLCAALRRRGGIAARFLVNYDMTFLAMAMSATVQTVKYRCPVHPLRRCRALCGDEAMNIAADLSVILAWWKLRDDAADSAGIKRFRARLCLRLMRRAYQKAARDRRPFAENTEKCLAELSRLESEKCASLDRAADCFARLLAFAAVFTENLAERRIREELFYHVGRSVYILDALDDLADDCREGNYNPLRYRFSPQEGVLSEEERESVRATLNQSQRRAAAALELRQRDKWQSILENIVCDGIPLVTDAVIDGKWKTKNKEMRDL